MEGNTVWTQVMGLLGFCVVIGHLTRHYSAHFRVRRAAAQLQPLGAELGLHYSPSEFAKGQGLLDGVYRDHRVHVDPDDARSIVVRFRGAPALLLCTEPVGETQAAELVDFEARDSEFGTFWKFARASRELSQALAESARSEWLAAFRGPLARNITSLRVDAEGVTVVVDFGHPPFIPTHAIRRLLGACTELAERIEAHGELHGEAHDTRLPHAAGPLLGRAAP